MISLCKASAGSGKTYTLAHTYLDLLKDDMSYRHILAVTFTNKATAEMKERILQYLSEDPDSRSRLTRILHDYSAFSVSTIDRFFQRALKAFAREIGQVADYQVELDRKSLIAEAMDRILDSLTGDDAQKEVLGWMRKNVADKLESGARVSIDKSLYDMGLKLKSEERRRLREEHGIDDGEFSKERLEVVRKSCRKIIRDFADEVRQAALALPEYGNKNADKQKAEYCNVVWYKKINRPKATLAGKAEGSPFMDLFGKKYEEYCTARLVEDQVFSLGLAREFFAEFEALLAEKNVLCLDDSNALLEKIIAGSDAPFVYEKMGVRYEHFLLDEFQDTSHIQWKNFLPLLRESDSKGCSSLVVGDVKQSIYRWRDSDWRLLANEVESEFPGAKVQTKQENRRSCRQVVEFNNGFFGFASEKLNLQGLYSDATQSVMSDDAQSGHVQVSFCGKDEIMDKIVESVENARAHNAYFKDIAILVRGNAEGGMIAEELIACGYPVVSDDSLNLNASFVVRKLVSLMSCIENPADELNSYITHDAEVVPPVEYHSLVGLCENMLRQLRDRYPDAFKGEIPFIQAFMDDLREWTEVNGNSLRYFLEHWESTPRYISSPKDSDAISILTIHKSKGLEFPYLIFPYAEKVVLYKETERWCYLDAAGTALDPAVSGIYSVKLSESSADTLFAPDYRLEREMQKVDNMNVFYVALTRARCCLHIISKNPPKNYSSENCKDFSQILYAYCGGFSEREYGSPYDFSLMKRKEPREGGIFDSEYVSVDLGERLKPSEDAADFFGEDGATGIDASPRRSGIVLHGILSRIKTRADLEGAVQDALLDGQLDEAQAGDALSLLSARIDAHPEFFDGSGFNETALLDSDGLEWRPDRVVIQGDTAIVVDYKFGEPKEKYPNQVRRYMRLYRELGYKDVRGYLWYVIPDDLKPL